jgi:DHA1 family multidrug resistance protein-like MFS transporter
VVRQSSHADGGPDGVSTPPSPESWQRNVWALALCVFIAFVGFQFFSPFLPLYIRELGVTDPSAIALWSGLLAAVTPTVSGLLSPLFGHLADRFGRKMMLIRSLAGFTVIIAAMGLVTSVQQLFVARLLQGLFAGFTPMAIAVASVSAPRDKTSVAIARVQGAQLLSLAVGPAVGGLVASRLGFRPAFFVTAGMCVVALVALIVLFQEVRTEGQHARQPGEGRAARRSTPLREFLRYSHFMPVMGLLLIAQFIDRGLSLLIPLQVAHMPGVDAAATSGLIIAVAAIGATLSAGAAARLSQIIPAGQLLLAQLLVGGAFCGLMALAESHLLLLVLRTVVALCLGGALTLAYTLGGCPPRRAVAASLPRAYLMNGALAWVGAGLLAFLARNLLTRHER